jgi:D-erythronate 2-dehydrogenase
VVLELPSVDPLRALLAEARATVFHLASVVSAGAEADWRAAVRVNVDGLARLLEACEDSGHRHRLVFASSIAVFGGAAARDRPGDAAKQTPTSTYGVTKAIGELLVADATRRGIVDGRVARLPTVVVRPGAPNLAASSFCSGMFREPLAGRRATVPVDPATAVVLIGTDTAVAGLARLGEIDAAALGDDVALGLPGLRVTVAGMAEALAEVGGPAAAALLDWEPDPAIEAIVAGWPGELDDSRARSLGLPGDEDLASIVRAYSRST